MYAPSDDTLLLAQCTKGYRGRWALEIGVGSGAVAESLASNFENVAGTDIHLPSLAFCSRSNHNLMLVCCDAASAFCNVKFDLVVANPPYLPDDSEKDAAIHGGPAGVETTIRFIESAFPLLSSGGVMLVVVSSRTYLSVLDSFLEKTE